MIRQFFEKRKRRKLFPSEFDLLHQKSMPSSDLQSVLFFTQNKCASVYTMQVIARLSQDVGLIPVNYEGYLFHTNATDEERTCIYGKADPDYYPAKGYCFGPFRRFTEGIPQIDRFRIILMLRDPRDVITSYYFSMAYSHSVPEVNNRGRKELLQVRDTALQRTIDDYAIEQIEYFRSVYDHYFQFIWDRPNVTFLTYREMVGDFEKWLEKLVIGMGIRPSGRCLGELVKTASFQVNREDPKSHIRQITPGDHKRKLQPETIEKLNEAFGETIETLGLEI